MPRIPQTKSTSNTSDAERGEYVKNEVDIKLDRVNDLWMKLEKKLLKEQPPRRITCCYDEQTVGDEGFEERRYLGIQRHAGKWRICYAITWRATEDANLPWKPIVECDVDSRTDAIKGVDRLKSEVANTRTFFIPALDVAIDKLESALLDEDDE